MQNYTKTDGGGLETFYEISTHSPPPPHPYNQSPLYIKKHYEKLIPHQIHGP